VTRGALAALAVALCLPSALHCQTPADTTPRIVQVTLDRRNVFDASDSGLFIARLANALHVTTRASLIRREFLFATGDLYDSARVAETARNLRALGVFSDVEIDTTRSDSGVAVTVMTQDGWSTRPDFRFHSTGGSIAYTLALIEDNLLGTVTQAQVLYRKDPDRSTTLLYFHRNRLIANHLGSTLEYADQSDGDFFIGEMAWPYLTLESRFGAALEFDTQRGRVLRFRDGLAQAHDSLERRYVLGRVDIGTALRASPEGYLRVGAIAQVRRDDYAPKVIATDSGIAGHTVTGAFGGYLEARTAHFITVRGYQSFGRVEDVDLSSVVRVSAMLAPTSLGYPRNGIAPGIAAHAGLSFPGGFALADLSADGLYTSEGLDSGQVTLGATAVLLPSVRHQLIVHGEVGALRNPAPGTEFDLGLGVGPRAFRQHAFTGDREWFATAEYRYTLAQEVLKVTGVGVAAFVDQGGAWWSDDAARSGWDVGVGLRLGPSRAPDVESTRIDIARRIGNDVQPGGWVLVIGKGFLFSTGPRGGTR
jgi:Surface antigen variable number repeat